MMHTATIQTGLWAAWTCHARGAGECLHCAIHYAVLSGGKVLNTHLSVEERMEAVLHQGGGWDAASQISSNRGGLLTPKSVEVPSS